MKIIKCKVVSIHQANAKNNQLEDLDKKAHHNAAENIQKDFHIKLKMEHEVAVEIKLTIARCTNVALIWRLQQLAVVKCSM